MGFLQMIIRNDAMKTDPLEIYGWRVYTLACCASFGALLFGMDSGTIGGVLTMPTFKAKYGIEDLDDKAAADLNSNIVSTLQAGCFAGSLIGSYIADTIGRKPGQLLCAVVALIGCVLQAASAGHLVPLYFGRFIAGLGTGGASIMGPVYISENSPRAIRGALTGLYQLFIVVGIMLSYWINYGCLVHLKGDAQWGVALGMQSIPPFLLFFTMLFCNESPRWLAKQDQWEKAQETLQTLRQLPMEHPYLQEEFNDMAMQLEHERLLVGGDSFWSLQKEMWTIPGNRKRALISIGLMICQQMTGTNAINYYAPQIFENMGITGSQNGLFATGVYGIVKVLGVAFFLVFMADSLGRRRSLLYTSLTMVVWLFYIGLYIRFDPPQEGKAIPPAGYAALTFVFFFAIAYEIGWGPVCWIYVAEIPSSRLRSTNVAIAGATQWLFNFVVAKSVPTMLVTVGANGYGTYLIFGSFCGAMFVFTWFLVPETKGISLERMDDLFGVTRLVEEKMERDEIPPHNDSNHKDISATNVEQVEKI
ncbi:hypothetical protein V493_00751 [Pseudogymnoascus sp. VKM F-4281 (FW-2241)]|nr:hypothetical protein V493_00751 [Pseudogymnoascus sp. VKM F-4281 (FW-2241)]